ncbi:hypothetical protein GN958_ATG07530 [Phytophthora infestans]|uniref:Uncharacterized protein n=1 Tax=Phytophthora infestans TaxID=4787 RepID=A0A8S9UVJ2_PHYIN|nr:hypothetical protein GN958_ATG07530 [Phytophthora infestans]
MHKSHILADAPGRLMKVVVGAKAVSTFYGRITDTMRMDAFARLPGEVDNVPGLACFSNQRFDNFHQSTRGVGAKAVSTFYGRITDSVRMNPFARLHGEVDSPLGLACFSNQRYDNFHQSTRGVGQHMTLERRG